jgi:hypothetical protein
METAISITHLLLRLTGVIATALGVLLLSIMSIEYPTSLSELELVDSAQTLIVAYWLVGNAVTLLLVFLAIHAARAGVGAGVVGMAMLAAFAVSVISLTADWPLYVVAGVGALFVSENAVTRIRSERTVNAA